MALYRYHFGRIQADASQLSCVGGGVLSITFSLHCFCDSGMDPILVQDKDLLRSVLSKVHGSGAGSLKVTVISS